MAKIQEYQVLKHLKSAEKYSFAFVKSEGKYREKSAVKAKYVDKVDAFSPFWKVMSFLGIPLVSIFTIYEAYMAKQAILTVLDPTASGRINPLIITAIGFGLALFAMYLGHIIIENVQKETDTHTGKKSIKINPFFWLAILGLALYIGLQYLLVQVAGEGSDEFMNFALLAVSVALLEALTGMLILGTSLIHIAILVLNIRLGFILRKLGIKARKTNDAYRTYSLKLTQWNNENSSTVMEKEGNENIRRALLYFHNSLNMLPETSISDTENSNIDERTYDLSNRRETTSETEIENFIDDNDNNITF